MVIERPLLPLGTPQDLLVWASLRAQWFMRCGKRLRGEEVGKEARCLQVCRAWLR